MFALLMGAAVVAAPPAAGAADEGRILVWTQTADGLGRVVANEAVHFRPDGTDLKTVTIPETKIITRVGANTPIPMPGFESVVFVDRPSDPKDRSNPLAVLSLEKGAEPFVLKDYSVQTILKNPVTLDDGTVKVYFTGRGPTAGLAGNPFTGGSLYSFDVKSRTVESFDIPARHTPYAVLRDGKTVITAATAVDRAKAEVSYKLYLVAPGSEPVELHSPAGGTLLSDVRTSSNGAVVLLRWRARVGTEGKNPIEIVDVKSKAVTVPKGFPAKEQLVTFVPSPDGKRIAFTTIGGTAEDQLTRVFVASADGSNATKVFEKKYVKGAPELCWR